MNRPEHTPASPAECKSALRALFESFPTQERSEGTAAIGTYLMAIEGYSLRAVQGAVRRIVRGEVDDLDKRFLPTPAQLGNLVAYMEKLYAPPQRHQALPAPGSETRTEEEWTRRKAQADAARERFGIKPQFVGETVVDRDAMPEALRAERDREVAKAASKLREGSYQLSEEAKAIFREGLSDRVVPAPDEAFDNWDKGEAA